MMSMHDGAESTLIPFHGLLQRRSELATERFKQMTGGPDPRVSLLRGCGDDLGREQGCIDMRHRTEQFGSQPIELFPTSPLPCATFKTGTREGPNARRVSQDC